MSDVNLSHPSLDQLIALGSGGLGEEETAAVRDHLARCDACRAARSRLGLEPASGSPQTVTPPPEGLYDDPTVAPSATPGPPAPADLPPPLLDHPRYKIVELLGTGGMGAVYKAQHRVMERVVALKVLSRAITERPEAVERFHQEVKAAARLAHPNIVTAYDAEQAGDLHFLVMEYVEGVSLAQLVQKRGKLPVAHACEFTRQAALGLQHAFERGMIHRDVKPQNLMVTPRGQVKVLDFGLARFASESGTRSGLTEYGTVMGTPDFMAPEQADDPRKADVRADLYSLGCTLYFLLAGQAPFPAGTPLQKIVCHLERLAPPVGGFRDDVPPDLARVVERLLAKDPADRYQTPVEVARALAPFIKSAPAPRERPPSAPALPAATPAEVPAKKNESAVEVDLDVPVAETAPAAKPGTAVVRKAGPKARRRPAGERRFPVWSNRTLWIAGGAVLTAALIVLGFCVFHRSGGGDLIRTFAVRTGGVTALAFCPDGRQALSGNVDGTVRLWQVDTGQQLRSAPGHSGAVSSVIVCSDGHTILSGSRDGSVRRWDLDGLARQSDLRTTAAVVGLAPLADRNGFVSATADGAVRVRDLEGWAERGAWDEHPLHVTCVAASPAGRYFLLGTEEKLLQMRDADDPSARWEWQAHGSAITGVAFSPDGQRVLSVGVDRIIRVGNLSGEGLAHLAGHTAAVRCAAFSPDGRRILSGGADATVRLWDPETFKELHVFSGHTNPVTCVAFSPDGKTALSGSEDGTLRLWKLP
jgi:WD40 repeat protein